MKAKHLVHKIIFKIKQQPITFTNGVYFYEDGDFKLKTKSGEVMTVDVKTLKEDLHQQLNSDEIKKTFIRKIKEWGENTDEKAYNFLPGALDDNRNDS